MLEKQFEELRLTGNLPSPNGVGLAILQITQRDDASLDEVVNILQADPTLTGRILKLANSASNAGYEPASTAREAAMRLGLQTVRNVSLGFSLLAGNRGGRCKGFDYELYWSHSLATAAASQGIAEQVGRVESSEAFTCGLLSGIGRLALASIHPDAYESVLVEARGLSSKRLAQIEQERFGTHHRELAAAMLRDWMLPASFADAVGLVGSGASADEIADPAAARLARVLQSARDLSRAMTTPGEAGSEECRARVAELDGLREHLGIDAVELQDLWDRVSGKWNQWGSLLRVAAQVARTPTELYEASRRPEKRSDAPEPVQARLTDTAVAAAGATEKAGGLRVLLVDEDGDTLRAPAALLHRDGHEVRVALDARRALALALEHAPHVIVTGCRLGETSALDLVRTLRRSEVGTRTHVILLAAPEEQDQVLSAFASGVDEYLNEPCDPRILQARVRAAHRVVRLNDRVSALLREREHQISELAIAKRKLQAAAVTDALTGLWNRRYALERLEREVAEALRAGRPLAVIMIDIDRFKSVNDTHGHDVGDVVLRETAGLLQEKVRRVDAACRLGGEEFLVICPKTDLAAGTLVAERLCTAARENVIESGSFHRAVTISLGVAQLDPRRPSVDALVKQADERVYLAKSSGRDRVVSTDEPSDSDVRRAG